MKQLLMFVAVISLAGCSSYQSNQGAPGMEEGSIGSEGRSQQIDLEESGEDTEHNATRRDSFGGSGGTAPGGGIGPR